MKLITSGCSFTETTSLKTWPIPLSQRLGADLTNMGLGSQGNGLIAKKLIYALSQLTSYKNVLVGVMWSGPDRSEQFTTNKMIFNAFRRKNIDGWQKNPDIFPPDSHGGWIIHNVHWTNTYAKEYYKRHEEIAGQIETLQNIIYIQSFLKANRIKYFMTNYTKYTFDLQNIPDVDYLYKLIDRDYFLPVEGCYEWCKDHTNLNFCDDGWHPSPEQHKAFVDRVILPFIKNKYGIDRI